MGVFKKQESWWIDYRIDGRRRREKIGPNKKLAETVLNIRLVEIAEGKFLDVRRSPSITFDEMSKKYLEWSRVNELSWSRDALSIQHLMKHFGEKSLNEISPFLVEKYKAERRKVVSPRTTNLELACLRHIFSMAIAWGLAYANPVSKVKFFKENNQRLRYLTHEEFERLVHESADHLKPFITAAFMTGMRKSELLRLSWPDIDFRNGLIYVRESKSGEGRQIPMNAVVRSTMERLKKGSSSEHVFVTHRGERLKDPRIGFEQAMKRAGIKGANFHTLHHSFASHLVMAGKSLQAVQKLMGHKTYSMTLRYAHLSPEHLKDTVKALEFLGGHHMDTKCESALDKDAVSS
ncbi:MAG: site-specific integrase [Pseudomonadota bacterium]